MELLDCTFIGVCAVIRLNTVCLLRVYLNCLVLNIKYTCKKLWDTHAEELYFFFGTVYIFFSPQDVRSIEYPQDVLWKNKKNINNIW